MKFQIYRFLTAFTLHVYGKTLLTTRLVLVSLYSVFGCFQFAPHITSSYLTYFLTRWNCNLIFGIKIGMRMNLFTSHNKNIKNTHTTAVAMAATNDQKNEKRKKYERNSPNDVAKILQSTD